MKKALLLLVASCVGLAPGQLLADAPNIVRTRPTAVMPGRSIDVTVIGQHLAGVTGMWTSFPAKCELAPGVEKNGQQAEQVTYRMTIPRGVEVGIGGLRVTTKEGVSDLQLIMLDDLPSVVESGATHGLDAAQAIDLPVAVDGICDALQADHFRFDAVSE